MFKTRKYDLAYKGLSSFGYETWYGEYSSTNTNFKNITNGETSFDELSKKLSETSDVKERNKILASLQKLEQEKLLKLNLFTFKNFLYLNTEKVLIPDDVQFGNPFYKFDYKFEKWDAK
ncbi:oligopeptide ABC transporteroligopeptide-binding protein [Streptococcus pneumoniae]|nr:oligopeptide ABC transporteroligopeptide-binding protein [Streptococcus pneumoniae]